MHSLTACTLCGIWHCPCQADRLHALYINKDNPNVNSNAKGNAKGTSAAPSLMSNPALVIQGVPCLIGTII
jgi:hypothetical protein